MTLTDEDRAAIRLAAVNSTLVRDGTTSERIYLAGLRAGMERAAKICEDMDMLHDADRCAEAIREAAK